MLRRRGAAHGTIPRTVCTPGYAFLTEHAQVWRRSRSVHLHKGETVIWPALGGEGGRTANYMMCSHRCARCELTSWWEKNH